MVSKKKLPKPITSVMSMNAKKIRKQVQREMARSRYIQLLLRQAREVDAMHGIDPSPDP